MESKKILAQCGQDLKKIKSEIEDNPNFLNQSEKLGKIIESIEAVSVDIEE